MLNMSFWIINLLIPDDPMMVNVTTSDGSWQFKQIPQFETNRAAILGGSALRPTMPPIAETYFLQDSAGADDFHRIETEVTPILLAATYATGMSVTSERALKNGGAALVQPSNHWPRARGLDAQSLVINTTDEFVHLVEAFVNGWQTAGRTEKALLLVHHWLDSLSCWSMEDLYLSATTLLQIIVATEATKQGKEELKFYPGIQSAATRVGIAPLSPQFKDMRNELVHDGQLIGSRFSGPDKAACAQVMSDVLNWFDSYLHAALALGQVVRVRFKPTDFMGLNAYSI